MLEPFLDLFAVLAHTYYYPLIVLMALFGFYFYKHKKLFVMTMLFAALVSNGVKPFYAVDRPCAGEAYCPESYGFPSTHAAIAGVFALASLGTPAFYFALPFSALLAHSRVYTNVHSFEQVAAGYALGAAVYLLLWVFLHKHAAHGLVKKHKLLE